MRISIRSSLSFGLACLLYLLIAPYLAAELSSVFKIIPILFLCALTIKSAADSVRTFVLSALVLSMGGDILLELGFFVPGLVSFLLAQLVYASLFQRFRASWHNRPPVSLMILAFSAAMAMLMWTYAGELRVPVLVYLLVISFMGVSANTSQIKGATLGAAIFILSDSIIALNRFVLPIPASDWLIMSSYYLAQYFLVSSLLSVRTPNSNPST